MAAKFIKFPQNFLWGGALASEQAEGHGNTNKGLTIWDEYYQTYPSHFYEQIGPKLTSNFFAHYKQDVAMWNQMDINSVRIGISWSRLIPNGNDISTKGLAYYHKLVNELNHYKIKIFLNLFHFDMPLWAMKKGGWTNKEVIKLFVKYAQVVFKEFGNKVDFFVTMNEPNVPIMGGYLMQFQWPLIVDNKKAFQAGFGTILAHAKTVNLFNKNFRDHIKAKIGVVINVNPVIIKDGINYKKEDQKAAQAYDILHNKAMLYPMVTGKFPGDVISFAKKWNLMPLFTKYDLEQISAMKLDFLGVNFYSPTRVQAPLNKKPNHIFEQTFSHYRWKGARYNNWRGWEIKPEALYELAIYIKNNFKNIPFYIAENGMGVQNEERFRNHITKEIDDDYRIIFLEEHLKELNKAISEGANCFGYHMWSIMDNWSWRNAYKNRYGFIEVDLKDQSRKFKKSAYWFRQLIEKNGFIDSNRKIEDIIDLNKQNVERSI